MGGTEQSRDRKGADSSQVTFFVRCNVLKHYVAPVIAIFFMACSGCQSPNAWAELMQRNDELSRDKRRIQRTLAQRDGTIAALKGQINTLKTFDPDRPADLFVPKTIEIASRSGGANYDDLPGDDGITVYLRPRDADGDVVKVPGRIEIQLLDNSVLSTPRVIGVYTFDDPAVIRKAWHGKFATNHYSLRCSFPRQAKLPASGRLLVSAAFVEFLTGTTLTQTKEVTFSRPGN